jgi:1,4-alpha-glucan branching enzyme
MGWMNDTLAYSRLDPLARRRHHDKLTFSLTYAFDEKFLLPLSHDEVVHLKRSLLSKMPGEPGQQFANLRALYGYMFAHPGKKLLFMGGELGQRKEWNHDAELEWDLLRESPHRGVREWVRALNELYAARPALHEIEDSWEGFEWLVPDDAARSVVAFVRRGSSPEDLLVVVANFTPVPRARYRLPVPAAERYRVVLRSDDPAFNGDAVAGAPVNVDGTMLTLDIPPMSVLFLEPVPPGPAPAPPE